MTQTRADALAPLEVFVGDWSVQARFPGQEQAPSGVMGRSRFAMTFTDGVWTLLRESPDFSPLDFRQRFTGTFSDDGSTITGGWEKTAADGEWQHDFTLIYHR